MESRSFDLLHTTNTSMIGGIGERIAQHYLYHARYGWVQPPQRATCLLTKKQKDYIDNWQWQETWGWDFIGAHDGKVYLVEVKTSRPGKRKHGLKGSWGWRARRGMSPTDLKQARQLGFHFLLVNVELLDNWQCLVTSQEIGNAETDQNVSKQISKKL